MSPIHYPPHSVPPSSQPYHHTMSLGCHQSRPCHYAMSTRWHTARTAQRTAKATEAIAANNGGRHRGMVRDGDSNCQWGICGSAVLPAWFSFGYLPASSPNHVLITYYTSHFMSELLVIIYRQLYADQSPVFLCHLGFWIHLFYLYYCTMLN